MPERASAPAAAPQLELRGISRTFRGVNALQNVQLRACAGQVHALHQGRSLAPNLGVAEHIDMDRPR